MAASIQDLLTQATTNSRPVPTTVSGVRAGGGTTLTCLALSGWPTATAVHFITYKIDTSNKKIAGTQADWKGIVSGTTITNLTLKAGTDSGSAIGDVVEASPTAAWANDVVAWGTAHANQDGSLIGSVVRTALGQTTGTGAGWTTLGNNPNTVTANGNRSYNVVFNAVDLTTTLSPGMRLLLQRTTAAPTQSTSLNGTTQYYSKATPAGMTFTNNFVVSAWVKVSAYTNAVATIASRNNGTSGWIFYVDGSGRVNLNGYNAGIANFKSITSYQSVPLNKWVHVAAQLDMTSATNSPTVNYTMFDGVDVPAVQTQGGTNPTSLINNVGDLNVGSYNSGAAGSFFSGKIAQVAIYSAKVTQATILASMHQALAGTETSLISAYSFNNTINDLNTTNANNLTANGVAVATNLDTPFTQTQTGVTTGTLNYGIVTAASFSTNTTVTVQVPEGDTIPTSGGVSATSYSAQKTPYGFPASRNKWPITLLIKASQTQTTPTASTWYNLGAQITLPIGSWEGFQKPTLEYNRTAATTGEVKATVSTANNTESDGENSVEHYHASNVGTIQQIFTLNGPLQMELAAATVYYWNIFASQSTAGASLALRGDLLPNYIRLYPANL